MAHLTYFDTLEEYNAYINSEEYVKPNISYCADVDAVFMKEDFVPSMSAVFNITDTGSTNIAGASDGIKAMRVDGQLLAQNVTSYTFTSTGNHTVEYQFKKQNAIPKKIFLNLITLASVDLDSINYIGDSNFNSCSNVQFGELEFDGNVGNGCFMGISGLTSIIVNGNIGNSNLTGDFNLESVRVNGNIGNGNIAGVYSLTDVYIDGNIGDNNFGGVSTITSMTINGSAGAGNYYSGFDTLHIKGNAKGGYISNVKHLIVDGDATSFSPGTGLEDIVIKGNLSGYNFSNINTLTAITIDGDLGDNNFSNCSSIKTLKIGGNVGCYNFSSNSHDFESVEISGNVGNYNYFYCNSGLTSNITISGDVSNNNYFYSGDTLTIKGDLAYNSIYYWKNVIIEGSITGDGITFNGVKNIRIKEDVTGQGIGWVVDYSATLPKESFIIDGSITNGNCFNGISGPMVQVGGSIGQVCFNSISTTDVTNYTVHGDLGTSCFNNVTGLTGVTVDGDVGANSFGITGSSGSNSITSLTLTENCSLFGGFQTTSVTKLTIQRETPPTLSGSIPSGITIYVPASALTTYTSDTDWGEYSSRIQAIPTE